MENDKAASGVVPGIMVLVILSTAAVGFLWLTNEFGIHYNSVIGDPTNNTGIMAGNNSSAYVAVKTTSDTITANLPAGILLAFLLAVIVFVLLIVAILKKGGD